MQLAIPTLKAHCLINITCYLTNIYKQFLTLLAGGQVITKPIKKQSRITQATHTTSLSMILSLHILMHSIPSISSDFLVTVPFLGDSLITLELSSVIELV